MPEANINELDDFKKEHPDVKINEWTTEEVEIPVFKPELDEKNHRVTIKSIMQAVLQGMLSVEIISTCLLILKSTFSNVKSVIGIIRQTL